MPPSRTALTLYGAPCSLYTAKVRPCFRKNSIPFEERFQSHPDYRSRILPAANNHRIPVVEFNDGEIVQDSALILDSIEKRFPSIPTPQGALRVIELLIEAHADRSMLKAAMHYRWNFPDDNLQFIRGEFGRILRFSKPEEWDSAGESIAGRMSSYLPPLGIAPNSVPAIEASYLKLLKMLNAHFMHYPYLLGHLPSRADYGLMGPLHAHLGRDPYPVRIMLKQAPLVFRWIERMNAPETFSPEFPEFEQSFFLAEKLPDTLLAVLNHMASEFIPEVVATSEAFATWLDANPQASTGSPISPKQDQPSFGPIQYQLEGRTIHQASAGHTLWMIQRMTDVFAALQQDQQSVARNILTHSGAEKCLTLRLPHRLNRLQNRLSLA